LTAQLLPTCERYETQRNGVVAHFGNPRTRVKEELNGTEFKPTLMQPEEFASRVLSSQHVEPELAAFLHAWLVSIDLQRQAGSGLAATAMAPDTFQSLFNVLLRNCRPRTDAGRERQASSWFVEAAPDPMRFLEDSGYRDSFSAQKYGEILLNWLIVHGQEDCPEYATAFASMYLQYVGKAPPSARMAMLTTIINQTEKQVTGVAAQLPFVLIDPDRSVASSAALSVTVMTGPDATLMSARFRLILECWSNGSLGNRGAVFGGLLLLGRVNTI
jgi:hypothetical protein